MTAFEPNDERKAMSCAEDRPTDLDQAAKTIERLHREISRLKQKVITLLGMVRERDELRARVADLEGALRKANKIASDAVLDSIEIANEISAAAAHEKGE